jgi:hypothetical protein
MQNLGQNRIEVSPTRRRDSSDRATPPDFRAGLGEWARKSGCSVFGMTALCFGATGSLQSHMHSFLTSFDLHSLLRNFAALWQAAAAEGMPEHGQSLAFLVTLVIFAMVMGLVLKRKITERFAILWMGIAFALMAAASFGYKYLFRIAHIFGIPNAPSALFLLAIFGLTLLVIELFTWVSKLNERSRILAQQLAILRDELEREMAKTRSEREEQGEGVNNLDDEPPAKTLAN